MRTFEEYIKEKEPTLLHNLKQFDLWKFIDKLNTDYITEIEQVKKLNIDDVSKKQNRKPVPRKRITDEIDFWGSTK
tara:strand:- start:687 stop:914 length:228 start_codon:yes stop_codon:yes gene_type:complete